MGTVAIALVTPSGASDLRLFAPNAGSEGAHGIGLAVFDGGFGSETVLGDSPHAPNARRATGWSGTVLGAVVMKMRCQRSTPELCVASRRRCSCAHRSFWAGVVIGYARCWIDKQDLAAQRDALRSVGVSDDRVYLDDGIGRNGGRPGLEQVLAAVCAGDTLVVPKLDRLARSVPDARAIGDSLAASGSSGLSKRETTRSPSSRNCSPSAVPPSTARSPEPASHAARADPHGEPEPSD